MKGRIVICLAWLLALSVLLSACQTIHAQATQSEGLQTYVGKGFSFRHPANAQVQSVSSDPVARDEIHIVGPQVSIKPGDSDWVYTGPAYEMIIATFDNPDGLGAESWARNHILASWQRAKEQGEPIMGPPVSEEGKIIEQQVGRSVVAGESAFWANFLAGDSYRRTFFLSHNHQTVALSFYDYPLENQPLGEVQQGVYALIMGTFSFDGRWRVAFQAPNMAAPLSSLDSSVSCERSGPPSSRPWPTPASDTFDAVNPQREDGSIFHGRAREAASVNGTLAPRSPS